MNILTRFELRSQCCITKALLIKCISRWVQYSHSYQTNGKFSTCLNSQTNRQLKLKKLQEKKRLEKLKQASNTDNVAPVTLKSPGQIRMEKDLEGLKNLPSTIKITFPNNANKMDFEFSISPTEGYYKAGHYTFNVSVSDNYPIDPPKVKGTQVIFHPNIDYDGNICLNILRESWSPALDLFSVIVGVSFLFSDPNPTDALNKEAADMMYKHEESFRQLVTVTGRGGYYEGTRFSNVANYDYLLPR